MNYPSATPRNEFLIMLTIVLGFMGAFYFQMISIIFLLLIFLPISQSIPRIV